MEREKGKSSVPLAHGQPNPFLNKAKYLVSQQSSFQALIEQVKKTGANCKSGRQGPGRFDIKKVMSQLDKTNFKQQLRALYDGVNNQPDALKSMGPNPHTDNLYGRFSDGSKGPVGLLDVGSGLCSKLIKYTGHLRISVNDKKLTQDQQVRSRFARCYEGSMEEFLHVKTDWITSWMSLCQVPKEIRLQFFEKDGLHMMPDHDLLIDMGIATRKGDMVRVRAGDRHFEDIYDDTPGFQVEVGYKLVTTYEETNISVTLSTAVDRGDYRPFIQAAPISFHDVNFQDVSLKNDGIPYELEIFDGDVYFTGRDGSFRKGKSNFGGHLCVHLEDMGDFYVLFKIENYKELVPPHYGDGLRRFLEKVHLEIDGKAVVGPVKWEPGLEIDHAYREDGLITRIGELDYYCKLQFTADVYDDAFPGSQSFSPPPPTPFPHQGPAFPVSYLHCEF